MSLKRILKQLHLSFILLNQNYKKKGKKKRCEVAYTTSVHSMRTFYSQGFPVSLCSSLNKSTARQSALLSMQSTRCGSPSSVQPTHSLSDIDVLAEDGGMLAKQKQSLWSQSTAVKLFISGTERQTRAVQPQQPGITPLTLTAVSDTPARLSPQHPQTHLHCMKRRPLFSLLTQFRLQF